MAVAAMGLSFCGTAFGKDSGHWVCSGVATLQADGDSSRIGISIVLDDYRAGWGGGERNWVLSWVYAGKLFQGSVRQTNDLRLPDFRMRGKNTIMRGHVAIKNGNSRLYVGTFRFVANEGKPNTTYALALDGKVTDDPEGKITEDPEGGHIIDGHAGSTKLHPIKAMLPCVDISI
jgi:hypothetical protein